MKKYYLLSILFLFYNSSFAQDYYNYIETPMPFLTHQQSPLFIGAGGIGAAVPMQDPLGFYLNPAQLGYFAQKNTFGFLAMPKKTEIFNGYMYDEFVPAYHSNSFGFAGGYNDEKRDGTPITVGAGLIYDKYEIESSMSYNDFYCLSLGISYTYYLQFSIGGSFKPYYLKRGNSSEAGVAFDYGLMITAPLSKLFFKNAKYQVSESYSLKPKFDITIGYSLTNLGNGLTRNEMSTYDGRYWFVRRTYTYPSPRTARAGYNLDFGTDLISNNFNINAVDFSFTAEAEDLLFNHDYTNDLKYKKSMFGGIRFVDHLVKFKKDNEVIVHRGNILRIFETLYFTSGRYYGRNYDNIRSSGYGFSTEGIFKLLSASIDNPAIRYISNHLVIEYYNAYDAIDFGTTNYQGIVLRVKEF